MSVVNHMDTLSPLTPYRCGCGWWHLTKHKYKPTQRGR